MGFEKILGVSKNNPQIKNNNSGLFGFIDFPLYWLSFWPWLWLWEAELLFSALLLRTNHKSGREPQRSDFACCSKGMHRHRVFQNSFKKTLKRAYILKPGSVGVIKDVKSILKASSLEVSSTDLTKHCESSVAPVLHWGSPGESWSQRRRLLSKALEKAGHSITEERNPNKKEDSKIRIFSTILG